MGDTQTETEKQTDKQKNQRQRETGSYRDRETNNQTDRIIERKRETHKQVGGGGDRRPTDTQSGSQRVGQRTAQDDTNCGMESVA